MKAIIFAAGVGKRLQGVTEGRPKCLVDLGGRTLLSRHVEALGQLGVCQVVLVVGYAQDHIRKAMAADPFVQEVRWVVNEQFTRGSITSLWAARFEMDDDVVLMDADVLYAPSILARLVHSPFPTALLMDETVKQESEECMIAAKAGRVLTLSKSLPSAYDEAGEGVGFLKVQEQDIPALLQSVQAYVAVGALDMEYEDALKEFFEKVPVGYEKIGGLPWIEIDFPKDIDRAESEILPAVLSLEENTRATTLRP
ncbi:phosphocholine cytidylyltransferase family protein [Candidatus Nitrospira allomarina]|uniref:Phosphocholine cytidylyltransferase family protein n=1 Tax=Candidatus Nitrospira allomarina TaxID=3020900 RepID=A0AA96GGN9_9BACT|nr:phosphocholine cytidylyltransferase family protein [Candidatus Nitrospira allomarina]WNM59750.1 phosphocholine cytidylyltransferase family protein [Candidatus Nitrospira allomarina]